MKLKLDENLGELARDMLTAAGHDVSTVSTQRMSGIDDATLYEVCCAERRVLITLDWDFAEVLRFPPEDTAGVVILYCRGRLSPASIVARLKELVALMNVRQINGQLWIVEPGRLRIHEKRDARNRENNEDCP
jgi:predicted nuclease of predicted toxin-antitoxin system